MDLCQVEKKEALRSTGNVQLGKEKEDLNKIRHDILEGEKPSLAHRIGCNTEIMHADPSRD